MFIDVLLWERSATSREPGAHLYMLAPLIFYFVCQQQSLQMRNQQPGCVYREEITAISTLLTLLVLAGLTPYAYGLLTWKAPGTTAQSKISSEGPACVCSKTLVQPEHCPPQDCHNMRAGLRGFYLLAVLEYLCSSPITGFNSRCEHTGTGECSWL